MFSRKLPSYLHARENSVDRLHRPVPERRVNLEELIKEEDESISSLCSTDSSIVEETISVCLRLRSHKQQNLSDKTFRIANKTLIVKATIDNNSLNKDLSEKHYTFSDIFDETVEQNQIYNVCVRPQLNKFLGERGATFVTYGTSGSGKTFTLLGTNLQPGIVPRAILQIFSDYNQQICPRPLIKIENEALLLVDDKNLYNEMATVETIKEEMAHCDDTFSAMKSAVEQDLDYSTPKISKMDDTATTTTKIFIWISFAEIYNENIYDLLADESSFLKKRALKVLSNDGNAYIKGLTALYAKSSEDAYSILQYGMKKATYGSTRINSNSSRSHSIFFMTIISFKENQDLTWVTYKFCDLAGSERLKKTGNMGSKGLKEAQRINTSLMVLGRCLDTVHQNQRHKGYQEIVPFRESKLTMLLQSSLLGKEKLTMVVNLLPIETFYEENLNVLNFSSIAKQIVVQKPVNNQRSRRSSQFAFLLANTNGQNDRYEAEIEKYKIGNTDGLIAFIENLY
jgi:kinesin family member 20